MNKFQLTVLFTAAIAAAEVLFSHACSAATINADSCSQADVIAAITAAHQGDAVAVPEGACSWNTTGAITITKGILLYGAGSNPTIITVGGTDNQPIVNVQAANVAVIGFKFTSSAVTRVYPINVTNAGSNFRIARNIFEGAVTHGIRVATVYGVIDENTFALLDGSTEFIQVRGPCNSWTTAHSIGGTENVFIEDNTITGKGYVTCTNDSRCVFRYNTITGTNKFDVHGSCTGSNPDCGGSTRGGRHYEVYNNHWQGTGAYYQAMDLRGGTGRVFSNTSTKTSGALWMLLEEHAGIHDYCNDYAPHCGCVPPLKDQIGVGMDPKVRGSEPLYLWNNSQNGSQWKATLTSNSAMASCTTEVECGADFSMAQLLDSGIDYIESTTAPVALSGYVPYTYPHPLRAKPIPPSMPKGVTAQ